MNFEKLISLDCKVLKNEPLAAHTSFKIGGPADFFIEIPNEQALAVFLKDVGNEKFYILGGGTNVLFSDSGYRGIVLRFADENFNINGDEVTCGTGFPLPLLVSKTTEAGLSGLECCAGIPGTVGGAVLGNAGSATQAIGDVVESVEAFVHRNGVWKKETISAENAGFDYRKSGLQNCIITSVAFTLKNAGKNDILKAISESINKRQKSQPLNFPSAGCIFKNPKSGSAGKFIDEAGLKGKKIGGAQISEVHANFVVNTGNATAADVLELANMAKVAIKQKFNEDLEFEIKII